MIKMFLKAKHSQLFTLLFVLPFLFEMAYMVKTFFAFQMQEPVQLNIMFPDRWMLFLVFFFLFGTIYGWYWSIVFGLKDKLPPTITLKTKWFRVLFFYSTAYFIIYLISFSYVISQSGFQYFHYFVYILPFHFLAMFSLLYLIYFAAKTFKTVELQREVRFGDFIAEFFLLWFNFAGVWILQPKINQIVDGTYSYHNENTHKAMPVEVSDNEKNANSTIKEYAYIVVQNKATGRKERITPEWWEETIKKYGDDKFTILHYLDANGDIINENEEKRVFARPPKSYLAQSILVTVFCCMPLGIVGIVNAANVESRFYAGDVEGAKRASKEAKKWSNIGLYIGLAGIVLYFVFVGFFFLMSIKNGAR